MDTEMDTLIECFNNMSIDPPEPTTLVRSTNDHCDFTGPSPPRIIQPFLWNIKNQTNKNDPSESASSVQDLPTLVPSGTNPECCYPVELHVGLNELCETLEWAFQEVNLAPTRNGTNYQWDVRTDPTKVALETIIDVQIFSNEEGALTVCFDKWYGMDNWRAYMLIDRIATLSGLGMIHKNPWKIPDDDNFPGILQY
jgi:hypothetical protein